MIQHSTRFRIASESVGAKVIDGEAVIVNVANGRYHSLDGTGADAWELLAEGRTLGAAAAELAERYEVEPERAAADLRRLADDLLAQELLSADGAPDPPENGAGGPAPEVEGRRPYAPPELVTFTDIEELLALDPPMPIAGDAAWKLEER